MRSNMRKRTACFWTSRRVDFSSKIWKILERITFICLCSNYRKTMTSCTGWRARAREERYWHHRRILLANAYSSVCGTVSHMLRRVSVFPVGLTKWHQTCTQAVWCVFICVRELPSTLHLCSPNSRRSASSAVSPWWQPHAPGQPHPRIPTPIRDWLGCSSHHVAACKCVCNECVNTVKPAGADISVCARGFVHTPELHEQSPGLHTFPV